MSGYQDRDFADALLQYWQTEDDSESRRIADGLWEKHGRVASVLILDMSGFSRITAEMGIVHYLSLVRWMQLTAEPVIERFQGEVIKFEADNCYALFPNPWSAVQAAMELNQAFEQPSAAADDVLSIRISCGTGHRMLLVAVHFSTRKAHVAFMKTGPMCAVRRACRFESYSKTKGARSKSVVTFVH